MDTKSLIIAILLASIAWAGYAQQLGTPSFSKDYSKIKPTFKYIHAGKTKLTGGVLYDRYSKNIENLYLKIDKDQLVRVFDETHSGGFAEPEFVGQYFSIGKLLYQVTGNKEIYARNENLVASVITGQRKDGYLGTYRPGFEFSSYSIWNQKFMIQGLVSYFEMTKDEKALIAATHVADYIANAYLNSDTLNLLDAMNEGIQNATILDEITRLYRITGRKLYLDFANFIVDKLESSDLKPVTIPNLKGFEQVTLMKCTKGAEMLITYFGILEMYRITGDEKYLSASMDYWEALRLTQIGITGNGTIRENWSLIGNTPVEMDSNNSWHSLNPNENCVAVSWMEFCAALAQYYGDSKYFDEYEKTLYNHLIGAQAIDGHDFSYYQGNIGHKVHNNNGVYSCCRYRGMKMLACLPEHSYMQSKDEIAVNIYTSSKTEAFMNDVNVKITQTTDYPRNGKVEFQIAPEKNTNFKLLLRKPEWCKNASVVVNGTKLKCEVKNGYLVVDNNWKAQGNTVMLKLEMKPEFVYARITNTNRVAVKYGPLTLAIDSRYRTPISSTMIKCGAVPIFDDSLGKNEFAPIVKFQIDGSVNCKSQKITLVDYASAGSLNPKVDEFRVWVPVLK